MIEIYISENDGQGKKLKGKKKEGQKEKKGKRERGREKYVQNCSKKAPF